MSDLSDVHSPTCLSSPSVVAQSLLPTKIDDLAKKENFKILMSHVLVENMKFFKTGFGDIIEYHIPHVHEEEMSKKSVVVCILNILIFIIIIIIILIIVFIGTTWNYSKK